MGNSCTSKPSIDQKPILVYFNVHSRGDFCQAFFWATNFPYENDYDTANSWPEQKDEMPFGQIPVLRHGDVTIAQGGAINRYCAKLAGLYPEDDVGAAICDMYMEEMMDIFVEIYKAKNAPDKKSKVKEWTRIQEEFIPKHFGMLEKHLERNGTPFFCGENINAADVSFFTVFNIYERAGLDMTSIIEKFPKLKKNLTETKKMGNLANYPERHLYFSADPENQAF